MTHNSRLIRQILLRDRKVRALVGPDRVGDPPALAIPEELDRVDAAYDDRAIFLLARLVGAPDVGDGPEALRDPVNLPLEEAAVAECDVGPVDIGLMIHDSRGGPALLVDVDGDESEILD